MKSSNLCVKKMSEKVKFHILLPVCVESDFDIFLNVLKTTVARSKFEESEVVCAFMSAMEGKTFYVKAKDLTGNWMALKSPSQEIRQMQLLGFWASKNFPTLPQKLFGEAWQPQPRHEAFVVGNPEFDTQTVDKIISAKMKLRVVEMSVNGSTFLKMKHFVKVPQVVGAGRNNETRVSRKMVTFDVDEDFVLCCWDALKTGVFNIENEQQGQTIMYPFVATTVEVPQTQIDVLSENQRASPVPKRVCRRHCAEKDEINGTECRGSSENFEGVSTINARSELRSDVANWEQDVVQSDSNIGSLREVILQIRDDVGTISGYVQGEERSYLSILNEKNVVIARLEKSSDELRLVNEKLLSNQSKLESQVENQQSLMVSMKKELDACAELNVRLKRDAEILTEKVIEAEAGAAATAKSCEELKAKIEEITDENGKLSTENECLKRKLVDAEQFIELNEKMRNELGLLKSKSDFIVKELSTEVEQLIKINSDSAEKNKELQIEISQLKCRSAQISAETSDDKEFEINDKSGHREKLASNCNSSNSNGIEPIAEPESSEQDYDTDFETDDPIVKECRPKLKKLQFGWMKFSDKKTAKYCPGLVHPPDSDGDCRAQKITATGYPASIKNIFYDFHENLAENKKTSAEKTVLNRFNSKFKFHYN